MMWWYDDNGMGWGSWIVMILAMVAFWGLVVFGIVVTFRGLRGDGPEEPADHDPMRILDERFARGEIDADEYHARQGVLRTVH